MKYKSLLGITSVGMISFLFIFLSFDVASADDPDIDITIRAGRSTSFTVTINHTQDDAKARTISSNGVASRTIRSTCRGPYTVSLGTTNDGLSVSGQRIRLSTSVDDYQEPPIVVRYHVEGTAQSTFTSYGDVVDVSKTNCSSSGEITIAVRPPSRPSTVPRGDSHLEPIRYASSPSTSTGCTIVANGGGGSWGATNCVPNNQLEGLEAEMRKPAGYINNLPICVSGQRPTGPCRASGGWTPYD